MFIPIQRTQPGQIFWLSYISHVIRFDALTFAAGGDYYPYSLNITTTTTPNEIISIKEIGNNFTIGDVFMGVGDTIVRYGSSTSVINPWCTLMTVNIATVAPSKRTIFNTVAPPVTYYGNVTGFYHDGEHVST